MASASSTIRPLAPTKNSITGRYVRYPRSFTNPLKDKPKTGPAHNRLFVSLLRAMGQPDTVFGTREAVGADGSVIPMGEPLAELHA